MTRLLPRTLVAAVLAVFTVACGPFGSAASGDHGAPPGALTSGRPATDVSPSVVPTKQIGPLLAVLQRRADNPTGTASADTVVIAGLDGRVHAQASLPGFGRAATLLQPEARVVGGKVYYADGNGAVHSLAPDGGTADVASFPMTGQAEHELSFAISPDGSKVMGSVITLPRVLSMDQYGLVTRDPAGPYTLDLYVAEPSQPAQHVVHKDLGTQGGPSQNYALPKGNVQIVGWDSVGPLATVDTFWATQQGPPGRDVNGTRLVHLDLNGSASAPLGGADCQPMAALASGQVYCADQLRNQITVRTAAGQIVSTVTLPSNVGIFAGVVSPDGTHIGLPAGVVAVDGSWVPVPLAGSVASFSIVGWIDSATLAGYAQCSGAAVSCPMAVAPITGLGQPQTIALRGQFVAAL